MVRVRAVLCAGLVLSFGLLLASPAAAAAEARAPEVLRLTALWERVLQVLENLLAVPAAPRPSAAIEADEGTPAPPPQPTGRGGMDPNG